MPNIVRCSRSQPRFSCATARPLNYVPTRLLCAATRPPKYEIPKEVVQEIALQKLVLGGKINCPTVYAPYGLHDDKGLQVTPSGIPVACFHFDTNTFITAKGAEICVPALIEEFNQHRDVQKFLSLKVEEERWKVDEIKTGNLGHFFNNAALARKKLAEFCKLSEEEKKEIRFYAKIIRLGLQFTKIIQELKVNNTIHFPSKMYNMGPDFPYPERVGKGQMFVLTETVKGVNLPYAFLTEIGRFAVTSFAALNDKEILEKLKKQWEHEQKVVYLSPTVSKLGKESELSQGDIMVNFALDCELSGDEVLEYVNRWNNIRDFAFLLHKI